MSLPAIEQLLKETMGLNSASIGSSAINRAVQQRMRERDIAQPEDYLLRLRGSPAELQQLIDLVIVPETWFFRDRHPFVALARYAKESWKRTGRPGPLRILSVPCSTGEEPYTIVMTLLDAGLTPNDFQVDAVDISEPNLHRARGGLYREHSFRGDDLAFRDRYFLRAEQGYLLQPEIRNHVRFHHANLLIAGFMSDSPLFDVVFCRNLLIYFDRATQAQALQVLERLLHPQGLLFLGHAEAGVLAGRDFASLEHPQSFAFVRGRKRDADSAPMPTAPPKRQRIPAPAPKQPLTPRPFASVAHAPAKTPAPAPDNRGDLDTATRLADEGHMVEAATLCEKHLQQCGPDAQAFYLLAIVRQAVGEPAEAEALLRKALYLDPSHYEALTHLAVLLEQRGDKVNAELVRQRAQRSHGRRQDEAAQRADKV
ncbi:MAG: chemotaxis protein CheR [Gammaproteobacteria bacterium]|nr:chemotaxis protein CheR [Gammaproteobacteria bacterium]